MAYIEKKKEGNKNIWVFKYCALYYWLMWPTILITLLSWQISQLWVLSVILWILLISLALPYWPSMFELKRLMKEKGIKGYGSKYSFSNPLRYEWEESEGRELLRDRRMKAKKLRLLTKVVLGLSLCAFCYPVFWSLYIIQNCPAILRATSHGSKGWCLVGGVGNGILFFSAVWIIYGIVRWVIIWPLYLIARCFCNSEKAPKADEPKGE